MNQPQIAETTGLLSIEVLVNGAALDGDVRLSVLEIEHQLLRAGSALLEVLDGDQELQKFAVSESSVFEPGNTVEIRLGSGDMVRSVFSGTVQKQVLRGGSVEPSRLRVFCTSAIGPGTGSEAPAAMDCGLVVNYGESVLSPDLETGTEAPGQISGSVSLAGTALPRPGSTMSLAGLGARFNGSVFIRRVAHRVALGNWVTTVDVGRPASHESLLISDENGNRISLSAAGISITSPTDIHVEANMGVSIRGAASAELVASGQTIVKGALVMIN